MIIPTHSRNPEVIGHALELYDVFATDMDEVTVERSDLSNETKLLVLGIMAPSLKKIYDLPEW